MRRLLFTMLLLAPNAAYAQNLSPLSPNANAPSPRCGPDMDGQVMCHFGVIYECEYIDPNSLEAHTGWRWHEDILRGCDTAPPPADLPANNPPAQFPGLTYAPQYNTQGTQSNTGNASNSGYGVNPPTTQPTTLAPPRRLR
jgi:hypothetical protein